jgi:hypothetical protein
VARNAAPSPHPCRPDGGVDQRCAGKARKRPACVRDGQVEPVITARARLRSSSAAHPHDLVALSAPLFRDEQPPTLLQYRSTIWSSFLLSNQDRPRNATSITMPSPEEALLMDVSENWPKA